ncbi:MAG TPA: threonine synthase [Candidatus Binatia bacterium]|nr:threonine synthase [Candidatus Binatia bacterium]
MGNLKALECLRCRWQSPSWKTFRCKNCGAVLEAIVDLAGIDLRTIRDRSERTIWRWFEFFPVEDRAAVVSLGEGYTPLIAPPRLAEALGLPRLLLKNDSTLPTGSLKDRSNAVGISRGRELGFDTAAVISTGNAAASVAAYAAAAGMKSVVMVPAGTEAAKILQAAAYSATVIVVEGSFDNEVARLYREALQEFGWYDCLSSNPYRNEGKKSYAYEMLDQLDGGVPDWVIHPTAGGAGICAMWKGWGELQALGCAKRAPRLVAAQSAAAAPIVRALARGLDEVEPVEARPTVAESIQVGNPASLGRRALGALRASKGTAIALNDEEILSAQSLLARLAGIFAEPAGAISVAAAKKLVETGSIQKGETVVCNITGHGLKQTSAVQIADESLQPIAPTLDALARRIEKRTT